MDKYHCYIPLYPQPTLLLHTYHVFLLGNKHFIISNIASYLVLWCCVRYQSVCKKRKIKLRLKIVIHAERAYLPIQLRLRFPEADAF